MNFKIFSIQLCVTKLINPVFCNFLHPGYIYLPGKSLTKNIYRRTKSKDVQNKQGAFSLRRTFPAFFAQSRRSLI